MYWNPVHCPAIWPQYRINRNMRCIEIEWCCHDAISVLRLIETWDVLKCFPTILAIVSPGLIETWDVLKCDPGNSQFRTRLRLIETWDVLKYTVRQRGRGCGLINRNMRCIEIISTCLCNVSFPWLIETWDVLKSVKSLYMRDPNFD